MVCHSACIACLYAPLSSGASPAIKTSNAYVSVCDPETPLHPACLVAPLSTAFLSQASATTAAALPHRLTPTSITASTSSFSIQPGLCLPNRSAAISLLACFPALTRRALCVSPFLRHPKHRSLAPPPPSSPQILVSYKHPCFWWLVVSIDPIVTLLCLCNDVLPSSSPLDLAHITTTSSIRPVSSLRPCFSPPYSHRVVHLSHSALRILPTAFLL